MKKLSRNLRNWVKHNKLNASLILGGIVLVVAVYSIFFTVLAKSITPANEKVVEENKSEQESKKRKDPASKIEELEEENRQSKYVTSDKYKDISEEVIKYIDKGNEKVDEFMQKSADEGFENITYWEINSAYKEYHDATNLLLAIEPPDEHVLEYNQLVNILNDYMGSIKYFNDATESNSIHVFIEAGVLYSRATTKLEELKNQ